MEKKAWCKTAQLILDHLREGCELVACIHEHYGFDRHGYVWHKERGEVVRLVQRTILERLCRDGFVIETRRVYSLTHSCRDYWDNHLEIPWRAFYRVTRDNEDYTVHAHRNREREALFDLLRALQKQQESLLRLSLRSEAADTAIHQVEAAISFLTSTLAGVSLPQPEVCST